MPVVMVTVYVVEGCKKAAGIKVADTPLIRIVPLTRPAPASSTVKVLTGSKDTGSIASLKVTLIPRVVLVSVCPSVGDIETIRGAVVSGVPFPLSPVQDASPINDISTTRRGQSEFVMNIGHKV
jgi:hypothetical protein